MAPDPEPPPPGSAAPERPWPVHDLVERLTLGRRRGGALLHPPEHDALDRILALPDAPLLALARLTGRVARAWRVPDLVGRGLAGVDDVEGALAWLVDAGLATNDVPWPWRLEAARRAVLAAGCARLGLARGGRRAELAARLDGHEGWDDVAWIALTVGPLVLRLERWATLEPWPTRSDAVLERMGAVRWVDHPVTGGRPLPSRAAWDAWEGLVDALATDEGLSPSDALDALSWPAWPPGRLDLRRGLRRRLADQGRALERSGDLVAAEALWRGLAEEGGAEAGQVAVRLARVLERQGRPRDALQVLQDAEPLADDTGRTGLVRAGRRLARAVGRAWVPSRPVRPRVERDLRLRRAGTDATGRPLWAGTAGPAVVEHAVVDHLARHGREALLSEGAVWRMIASLLFADATFLPIPGQLPVVRLDRPLDHGTPAWAARRAAAVWEVLDGVRAGEAAERVGSAWDRYEGSRVAGIRWDRVDRAQVVAVAAAASPSPLLEILHEGLRQGRRAWRGMPDLIVLPGPPVRLEGAFPSALPGGLLAVEVKGPGDRLHGAQEAWVRRMGGEVWRVVEAPSSVAARSGAPRGPPT